ncbi:MAG TPA: hypothetical protein VHE35_14195 [Kofleriaceae bacterium]|nr:hypothetical protein [Kofleriaceae bacterium]
MRRWASVVAAVVLAVGVRDIARVEAQPASAIGQPLPDPKLEARTVMVRVIDGDPKKAVTGVDVTLSIVPPDGGAATERVARTDADGRAKFVDLPSGAIVMAKVTGPGGEQTSTGFAVPATGGIRVMLSTVPLAGTMPAPSAPAVPGQPGAATPPMAGGPMAGGPMAGGAGGPPEPRMMSGKPRPQTGDPADTLTVRVTYDDLVDPRPPQDQPVLLVAYRYDQTVTAQVVKTDPAGRAVFAGLDRTGATSYFAMATLARGDVHDRVTSGPIQMVADDGLRLMLSGEKRDGGKPAVDDLGTLSPQPDTPVPAGQVDVIIAGVPEDGAPVELVDAVTGKVLSTDKSGPPAAAPGTGEARWKPPIDEPTLPLGSLEATVTVDGDQGPPLSVEVRRHAPAPAPGAASGSGPGSASGSGSGSASGSGAGSGSGSGSGSGAASAPAPAGSGAGSASAASAAASPAAAPAPVEAPLTATTNDAGKVTITGLTPGEQVDVVVVTPGGPTPATTVTIPERGGEHLAVDVTWKERGQGSAHLDGAVAGDDRAYYVRTRMHGQLYLSAPFQVTPERGAQLNVVAMPRVMLSFSLTSWVDDQFLAFSGQFTVSNASWAPYMATKDGHTTDLALPMPAAATGLQVRDDFASLVGTDPERGFILRRPIPPGGLDFYAGFSIKVDDGVARWDMPLPIGSFESGLELLRPNTTTRIVVAPGTKVAIDEAKDSRGTFWVMSPITIPPSQRMVFTVTGLPKPPAWNWWSKAIVGAIVLVILLGGLGLALHRGAAEAARDATRARYDRLLDELVGLERDGADPVRRAALLAELEALRERLDQVESSAREG